MNIEWDEKKWAKELCCNSVSDAVYRRNSYIWREPYVPVFKILKVTIVRYRYEWSVYFADPIDYLNWREHHEHLPIIKISTLYPIPLDWRYNTFLSEGAR